MNWLFRTVSSGPSPETTRRVERSRTTGSIESQNCAERLRNYRDLAEVIFEEDALERAYEAELAGNIKAAIRRYELGLSAIKEGLGQKAVENGLGPQYDNVARWHGEINQWQILARDRLKDLQNPSKKKSAPPNLVTQAAKHTTRNTGLQRLRTANGSIPFKSGAIEKGAKDLKLRETILAEVLDRLTDVGWNDIAGLEKAKQALQEMVVLPALRADLFQGLRSPARGLLLYGPPGNGKTLLARALAGEAQATFFNISASSLTSKWHGEAEKLVRTLFEVATEMQPSIIFIDEIDSILSERSSGEHEASRRLKTQFLVELDGVTKESDRVVVIGATNRPQELDDAVRRRLVKRVYVPMPDNDGREALLRHILKDQRVSLTFSALKQIASATEGYSGSDLAALCREAAMQPIRQLGHRVSTVPADEIRPIMKQDFDCAMTTIRPSVSPGQLASFEEWTRSFGSSA